MTEALVVQYYRAGLEAGYWDARYLTQVRDLGGLGYLRRALSAPRTRGVARLVLLDRADLLAEAVALRPDVAPLLTSEQLAAARARTQQRPA